MESFLQRGVILLQTDNTTVLPYINKMGATRSPSLDSLTRQITVWCLRRGLTQRAVHLSGADNVNVDLVSRKLSEQKLLTTVFGKISGVAPRSRHHFDIWGNPLIDLFAPEQTQMRFVFTADAEHRTPWLVRATLFKLVGRRSFSILILLFFTTPKQDRK